MSEEKIYKHKIFIVEDDEVIARAIKENLQKWDLDAKSVKDFRNVMTEFADYNPQLVIMDIGLPNYDGYYWCDEIRKISKVPIVFLSSADENMNIVMALSAGADDFISKPFDIKILIAKIKAILRRTYDFAGANSLLRCGDVILDISEYKVKNRHGEVELTKNECKILSILMENKDTVVPRSEIMKILWESDEFVDENTLSVNINRLRKKLQEIKAEDMIATKKGEGYVIHEFS